MAVAVVQYKNTAATSSSMTSAAATFTSNNTAGNMLVAIASVNKATALGVLSVADSQTQTYSQIIQGPEGTNLGNSQVTVWGFQNCAAGANTITVTSTIGEEINLDILELSGTPTSGALDGASGYVDYANALYSGYITTVNSTDLFLAICFNPSNSSSTWTVGISGAGTGTQVYANNSSAVNINSALFTFSTTFTGTWQMVGNCSNGGADTHGILVSISNNTVTPATQLTYTAGNNNFTGNNTYIESQHILTIGNNNLTGNNTHLASTAFTPSVPVMGQLYPQTLAVQ